MAPRNAAKKIPSKFHVLCTPKEGRGSRRNGSIAVAGMLCGVHNRNLSTQQNGEGIRTPYRFA